jgi:hypothetical protein
MIGFTNSIAPQNTPAVLTGTDYIYVSANGTPTENAIELQAAYDLAKAKVNYQELTQPFNVGRFRYRSIGDLSLSNYNLYASRGGFIEDGIPYELLFDGVSYFAISMGGGMMWYFIGPAPRVGNYTTLEILKTTITYNIVTLIVATRKYSFENDFLVDSEHINIVSSTGNADIVFTGIGTIVVTANNILLKGIDVQDKAFLIATDLELLIVENCKGGDFSFGGVYQYVNPLTVSGTYLNCLGGEFSFGGEGYASGIFTNCIAKGYSFGQFSSGIFTDCLSTGGASFGSGSATPGYASGTFIRCVSASSGFGTNIGAIANGLFIDCRSGDYSFGCFGIASGTFINCIGGMYSFGGSNNSYAGATCSGVFTYCIADMYSFGSYENSILNGNLNYCKLISGYFAIVTPTGKTRYCLDGNNEPNNQG